MMPEKTIELKPQRALTSFDLSELREPWEAYCKANGISSGEALRNAIRKLIATSGDVSPLSQRAEHGTASTMRTYTLKEGGEKWRVQLALRLSESERFAISESAKADGFKHSQQWIIALIRARLTDQPQFGAREIEALGESNRQLLAIGRNLNQIAHALNTSHGNSTVQYDVELVDNLATAVKIHVKKVGDALRASIYRWTLK